MELLIINRAHAEEITGVHRRAGYLAGSGPTDAHDAKSLAPLNLPLSKQLFPSEVS
jgi:hypothetical protein